jgi:rRNA maturation protein Nop10
VAGSFDDTFVCPRCSADVIIGIAKCPKCGEVLDWSEEEEGKPEDPPERESDAYVCPACGTDLLKGFDRCPKCGGELDWDHIEDDDHADDEQKNVNSLLGRGIFFSVFWVGGLGSIYAVILARRAKEMIELSHGRLKGMGRVWWCTIVGWAGIGVWGIVLLVMLIRSLM